MILASQYSNANEESSNICMQSDKYRKCRQASKNSKYDNVVQNPIIIIPNDGCEHKLPNRSMQAGTSKHSADIADKIVSIREVQLDVEDNPSERANQKNRVKG
jgi:hypothetical protein